jgi:hypothetical protein
MRCSLIKTIALAVLAIPLTLHAGDYIPESYRFLPKEAMKDARELDLKYLRKAFLETNRSFSYTAGSEAAFSGEISRLIQNADRLTFGDLYMGISRAVAHVDDGHTSVLGPDRLRHFPIRVSWFGDDLHVIRARDDHSHLLGNRVLHIAGKEPRELLQMLEAYIGGSQEHVKALSPDYLDSPDALVGMGIIEDGEPVEVSFDTSGQGSIAISFHATLAADPILYFVGWRDRAPDTEYRENKGWSHLLENLDRVPIYLQDGNDPYERVALPGHDDIFYMRLRATMDADVFIRDYAGIDRTSGHPPLRSYLLGMLSRAAGEGKYRNAVIDLRFNPGGNYMNTMEFARALPRLLPKSGKIFVITNNNTFSAAIVTTAFLKAFGGDRTVIVGERVGDREQFWAESQMLTLPISGIRVLATQGYHNWSEGCTEKPECGFNTLYDVAAGSLSPDIPVAVSFDDYVNGRDPMLEAILREIGD